MGRSVIGPEGFAGEVAALFVVPRGPVVCSGDVVKAGIQAVFWQLEALLDYERSVSEVDQILLVGSLVLKSVMHQAAEKGDVGPGADLQEHVGGGGGPGESRIDHDHLGVALPLGLDRPFESARMILGWIAPHDQHDVGILNVDPAIGHGPAPKSWPQTGDRRAVSNPGLVFYVS